MGDLPRLSAPPRNIARRGLVGSHVTPPRQAVFHAEEVHMDVWIPTLLGSGLLVTLANHLLAHRRESDALTRDAVIEIRLSVGRLARIIRRRGTVEIDGRELAASFRDCEEVIRTQRPALRGHWGHLVRSVRAAVGEDAGMPSWADLDWSEAVSDLSPVDRRWWQYAVEYLEYVDARLGSVAIGGEQIERVELLDYDTWLRRTGRFMGVGIETVPKLGQD